MRIDDERNRAEAEMNEREILTRLIMRSIVRRRKRDREARA